MRKMNRISETAIELANRIERRIRAADPAPGTPFKKTVAVAKEFGVSTSCANLAMRLLVQRKLVERRPRAGTLIADYKNSGSSPLEKIHFVMPGTDPDTPPEQMDDLILGVQSIFPGAEIRFTYYERDSTGTSGAAEIRELIKGNVNQAFILVRAPLALQRLAGDSGLPCVVLGHPFPTVRLPWIDADSSLQGELAASCVLNQPGIPALLLMQNRIAPGDHLFMEGFKEKMRSSGWDLARLTERFVPPDSGVIGYTVKDYLKKHTGPCAMVVPVTTADMVFKTIRQMKETRRVFVISIRGINCKQQATAKSTVIGWEIGLYDLGRKLGELLLQRVAKGRTFSGRTVFSPRILPAQES